MRRGRSRPPRWCWCASPMRPTCRRRTRRCARCATARRAGSCAGARRAGAAAAAPSGSAARCCRVAAQAARRAGRGGAAPASRRRGRALRALEDVVALAGEQRDIALKFALERDVRLVRFEQGRIEFALADGRAAARSPTISRARCTNGPGRAGWWRCRREPGAPTLRERAPGAPSASARAAPPRIRWCRRCWRRFPGARSSTCATEGRAGEARDDADRCSTAPTLERRGLTSDHEESA